MLVLYWKKLYENVRIDMNLPPLPFPSKHVTIYQTTIVLGSYEIITYWKNLKNRWRQSLAPSLPSRNKTRALVVKMTEKQTSKFSRSVQFCLISWHFLQILSANFVEIFDRFRLFWSIWLFLTHLRIINI